VPPWAVVAGWVIVAVRVAPKARGAGLDGVRTDGSGAAFVIARVNAPAEGGKANAALLALLARA